MDARTALKKLADRKEQEIKELRSQLTQAEAYLQGIQDSLKVLPREPEGNSESITLRAGTSIAQARDILKEAGHPLHILEILKRMGKAPNKQNRVSLSGSIASYVRRNQVFRKAAPNTFTLVDLRVHEEDLDRESNPIPEDFGKMDFESNFSTSTVSSETSTKKTPTSGQKKHLL